MDGPQIIPRKKRAKIQTQHGGYQFYSFLGWAQNKMTYQQIATWRMAQLWSACQSFAEMCFQFLCVRLKWNGIFWLSLVVAWQWKEISAQITSMWTPRQKRVLIKLHLAWLEPISFQTSIFHWARQLCVEVKMWNPSLICDFRHKNQRRRFP